MTADMRRRIREGGKSQNLILFIRGNAMSGAASMRGISQFPNPPIKIGMTIKKIIRKAWAVTITLYSWSLPKKAPGWPSSTRMIILILVPVSPPQVPSKK